MPRPIPLETSGSSSDKVHHHGYHRFYQPIVDILLTQNVKKPALIEIGVLEGASIGMWRKSLPQWFFYGMDIGGSRDEDGVVVFKGDQSKKSDLTRMCDSIKHNVYLINDDGSHIPEHQVLTFNTLFPLLQKGGYYIIEDIETSYWTKNVLYGYETRYGYGSDKSLIERFKSIMDVVNWEFLNLASRKEVQKKARKAQMDIAVLKHVSSITFAHNCVILKKKVDEDLAYDNRQYRFESNL
jgi:hypothetical protein